MLVDGIICLYYVSTHHVEGDSFADSADLGAAVTLPLVLGGRFGWRPKLSSFSLQLRLMHHSKGTGRIR